MAAVNSPSLLQRPASQAGASTLRGSAKPASRTMSKVGLAFSPRAKHPSTASGQPPSSSAVAVLPAKEKMKLGLAFSPRAKDPFVDASGQAPLDSASAAASFAGESGTKELGLAGSFAEELWSSPETAKLVSEALKSPFINGVGNGNLKPDDWGKYNLQDAVYLYKTMKNFQQLEPLCHDDNELKKYYHGKHKSYTKYARALFDTWRIADGTDGVGVRLSAAVEDYLTFHAWVLNELEPEYYLIANYPCFRLWPTLAIELDKEPVPGNIYADWIENNKSMGSAERLAVMIDKRCGKFDKEMAKKVFLGAMESEVDFFSCFKED